MRDDLVAPSARPPLEPPWTPKRGDLSRLLALSDGIFAFALTLLVLGIALPLQFNASMLWSVLVDLKPAFLAFVLSFFVIALYWLSHQEIFAYIVRLDRLVMMLNIGFLLTIAIMPFVTDVLATAGSQFLAVAVYSLAQIAAGGLLALIWLYATRWGALTERALPASWIDYLTVRLVLAPALFAVSIPVGYFDPLAAEISWIAILVLVRIVRHRLRARSKRSRPPEPP
ncbi:MAG TPA: TMEM175 family protein [Thermoplasmata archaeon]|nr:TMEM175 family protein [Thermoplasmata archaeon]